MTIRISNLYKDSLLYAKGSFQRNSIKFFQHVRAVPAFSSSCSFTSGRYWSLTAAALLWNFEQTKPVSPTSFLLSRIEKMNPFSGVDCKSGLAAAVVIFYFQQMKKRFKEYNYLIIHYPIKNVSISFIQVQIARVIFFSQVIFSQEWFLKLELFSMAFLCPVRIRRGKKKKSEYS